MIRTIAFYLPQFHQIPENDEWWGKGFTEWTNVTKAKPIFKGHYQPHLPSDLGFYDLRVPEVREEQARLAKEAGISAFCYWHYWFGNGKRLLERPFNEVLASGKPDFPFCLAWANESWTGKWHGLDNRILIQQSYFGVEDYEKHFYSLAPAFADKRYFKYQGRNIFVIYTPTDIPDLNTFLETWRSLALKNGMPDFYFIGFQRSEIKVSPAFDAFIKNGPTIRGTVSHPNILEKAIYKLTNIDLQKFFRFRILRGPQIYHYKDFVKTSFNEPLEEKEYPTVVPNWDNTPRSGRTGLVLHTSTPELYGELLEKAIKLVTASNKELVFIKAWNEWAEGNTLEPSLIYRDRYLKVTRTILNKYNNAR